jgi:RNA polymerase sigma factor (sigma-70 family)
MDDLLSVAAENRRISDVVRRERRRLFRFIRERVDDEGDAEDILQDVFYELTEAYRLMKPVEQAGAWLYRVARNRIIDRFRKRRPVAFGEVSGDAGDEEARFEDLLPSPDDGPEAAYARSVLSRMVDALTSPLEASGIALSARLDRAGNQIAVGIAGGDIVLDPEGDHWTGTLDVIFAQHAADGHDLGTSKKLVQINSKASEYQALVKQGVSFTIPFPPPARTQVRVVVLDEHTGRLGWLTIPLGN